MHATFGLVKRFAFGVKLRCEEALGLSTGVRLHAVPWVFALGLIGRELDEPDFAA